MRAHHVPHTEAFVSVSKSAIGQQGERQGAALPHGEERMEPER